MRLTQKSEVLSSRLIGKAREAGFWNRRCILPRVR